MCAKVAGTFLPTSLYPLLLTLHNKLGEFGTTEGTLKAAMGEPGFICSSRKTHKETMNIFKFYYLIMTVASTIFMFRQAIMYYFVEILQTVKNNIISRTRTKRLHGMPTNGRL